MTSAPTRVTAISGLGGKSPACFLVESPTARFLLDLGEGPVGSFPDVSRIGRVDAILISHGHADHIGGLHLASEVGDPPIYATAMTRAFEGHPKLQTALDLPLGGTIIIADTAVQTGRAGHAAGAVWMRIGGEDGVLYTGDLCRESILYPVDPPIPAQILITDASYGTYDDTLAASISTLIEQGKIGPLLLPLPPTGRGLEIAVLLSEAGVLVSLCEQHRRVATLMCAAASGTLTEQGADRINTMLATAKHLTPESPADGVMIAGNGGATGGTSRCLMEKFLADTSIHILFTGHVESGTDADRAIASGRAGHMRWNVHPRFSDQVWLHRIVRPEETLNAF